MKAALFHKKHHMTVENVPCPEAVGDLVTIQVHFCGVCGTDVHIYEGEKGSAEVHPPTILGHEFSGQVVAVGENVSRVAVGDRVSVDPNDYCGMCYHCANGMKHLCSHMVGLGTGAAGGFAEMITVPERLVYHIPDNLSYEAAAMIEPLSCCLHGIDLTEIKAGHTVMVVGAGNIGLMMIQLARHLGAARVIAVEPNPKRRERAVSAFGADFGIDPLTEDTDAILAREGIACIDRVIDTAGLTSTNEYSIHYAGRGATVMLFGLTGPDDIARVKPFELFQKELTIKGSFVNPDTFSRSIKLLEAGIVHVDDMITEIVPLDHIQQVFDEKLYAKDGKVLIKCC